MNLSLKRTPLYDRHVALGARMGAFGGWDLPIYYSGILAEHRGVRARCGFFDVSHLGELRVKGPGALELLQSRLTGDFRKLSDGRIQYTLLCDEKGGVLDDLLIYRNGPEDFLIIVNAANITKDFEAIRRYAPESLKLTDDSDSCACVAVQGPASEALLEKVFGFKLKDLAYYQFKTERIGAATVWVSRTGYTGEDGFEIFAKPEDITVVWDRLARDGVREGAVPAGLGARDTLRLEAGNALYGSDVDERNTPFEAGLGFAVDLNKGPFVGRDMLARQKEKGVTRRLAGFKVLGKPIARQHTRLFVGPRKVGEVTSGSFAPSVGANIGLAYVDKGFETPGTRIEAEIRDERVPVEIVKRPFIELKHKKAAGKGQGKDHGHF